MKITRTTTKTYDVKIFPGVLNFTFGEFREAREKRNSMKKKFEKCFCCGRRFEDGDKLAIASVSGKGNLLVCAECAEKYAGL